MYTHNFLSDLRVKLSSFKLHNKMLIYIQKAATENILPCENCDVIELTLKAGQRFLAETEWEFKVFGEHFFSDIRKTVPVLVT